MYEQLAGQTDGAFYPWDEDALEMFKPEIPTFVREQPKIVRNDPCPCGSGKNIKNAVDGDFMSVDEIIEQVTDICKKNQVEHLSLFGSYAKGTQTPYSDLDFIVYGTVDMERLQEQVDEIMTLKKIDLFEYDLCQNKYLKEDMDRYGRKIY